MSMQRGFLVPFYLTDVLPGDSFRHSIDAFLRYAPMLAPVMDMEDVFFHVFFVPDRLIWDESEEFHTGGKDGTAAPVPPFLKMSDLISEDVLDVGKLPDYLGLPSFNGAPTADINVSALPFRAYQLVYNEYFRDQNLSDPVDFGLSSGDAVADITALTTMRRRAWEKDYFTSALPWTQRGAEVLMPLHIEQENINYLDQSTVVKSGAPPQDEAGLEVGASDALIAGDAGLSAGDARIENIDTIEGGSTTVRDFRRASRLEQFLEKMATGGSRYWEFLWSIFRQKSPDARLQRPELLGGSKQPVVMSEVLSTVFQETIPQGTMAGHGVSAGSSFLYKRHFVEHGWIVGFISIKPRTSYMQGVHRMWTRENRFDWGLPDFAHIGEQEVKNKELYYQGLLADDPDGTFGYQSRYAEYKYGASTVHGQFKTTLAYWHGARIFTALPVLNESFILADPTVRFFAIQDPDSEDVYVQVFNQVSAVRPLPYFGTPRL